MCKWQIDQQIDYFSFVCSVAWPLNRIEDGSDLALLQTFLFLHIFTSWLAYDLRVSSPHSLLPCKDKGIENMTVKRPISTVYFPRSRQIQPINLA